ncbi:MAG TPA: hypothetical protein PLC88_00670 [Syntrophomonas sp.]|nr:hypothetical protein [Syntrophomonas sp.]
MAHTKLFFPIRASIFPITAQLSMLCSVASQPLKTGFYNEIKVALSMPNQPCIFHPEDIHQVAHANGETMMN